MHLFNASTSSSYLSLAIMKALGYVIFPLTKSHATASSVFFSLLSLVSLILSMRNSREDIKPRHCSPLWRLLSRYTETMQKACAATAFAEVLVLDS